MMNTQNIESKFQKLLLIYFIIIFITTIVASFAHNFNHNSWVIGDWLINYQAGFVRRGLIGEIVYIISESLNISPGFIVSMIQSFFYAVFLFFSYKLLKIEKNILPLLLLIFSPFIFLFQINDMQGGFRKEIIFIALMAYIVWVAKTNNKKFKTIFFSIMLVFPLAILSHELIAIYLPYIVAVYFIHTKEKINWKIIFVLVPSIISFLFAIKYKGNENIANLIYFSLEKINYTLDGGAIEWLKYDSLDGYNKVLNVIYEGSYIYYIVPAILVMIAFIPIKNRLFSILKNKLVLILISISIISSIGLFIVAVDWGRWIYIHAVAIFLITLLSDSNDEINKFNIKYYLSFVLVYFLFWHIPHCCNAKSTFPNKISQINVFSFGKPYVLFVGYYFPNLKDKIKSFIKAK